MSASTLPYTYLYITCQSHSGSTLLELLLGSHPHVTSVGEVVHFGSYYQNPQERCGCHKPLGQCDFWKSVLGEVDSRSSLLFDEPQRPRLLSVAYPALLLVAPWLVKIGSRVPGTMAARNRDVYEGHWALMDRVQATTGSQVIVDASMSPSRVLELYHSKPDHVTLGVLHLIRGGRGNTFSHMTRFNTPTDQAARNWVKGNRRIQQAVRVLPPGAVTTVRYEQLATHPEATLQSLCDFLGIAYVPEMLRFRDRVQHGIGGNPMRYRTETAIIPDRRWITGLSDEQKAIFARIGGDLNRQLGFQPTGDAVYGRQVIGRSEQA